MTLALLPAASQLFNPLPMGISPQRQPVPTLALPPGTQSAAVTQSTTTVVCAAAGWLALSPHVVAAAWPPSQGRWLWLWLCLAPPGPQPAAAAAAAAA
eukprot:CAMPEP_0202892342 /NCGR_PEP_ID=MMETSP1392-20130828/2061_1 /ASSEMBLY_ACC=CAM_ASM_000868 /TAXON_ID=225041 /ORGANISM="Chlamydomonas chlamydogama, Strain SAG 11-48b" /LENGTH=97 /DNA_ID=CAMNT_0049576241 /DNA_START=726 /DNA_END=1020 /DNA_ORIENTATION=+